MPPHTVFIVGAGASVPFHLPTGTGLRDRLCDQGLVDSYATTLRSLFPISDLEDVIHSFRRVADNITRSGCDSIDSYLESNPEHEKIGKLMIAASLLPDEVAAIKSPSPGWNWIGWIFNKIRDFSLWESDSWPVGFITFNYDRILEFALRDMLHLRLKKSIHEASRIVQSAPIVHVYGKFTDLAENDRYSPLDEQARDMWNTLTPLHYRRAEEGIDLLSATRTSDHSSDRLTAANTMLQTAETVIFLGFGFDSTNLSRLGVSAQGAWQVLPKTAKIFSTMHGLLGAERHLPTSIIQSQFSRHNYYSSIDIFAGLKDEDCLSFLRRCVDSSILLGTKT